MKGVSVYRYERVSEEWVCIGVFRCVVCGSYLGSNLYILG